MSLLDNIRGFFFPVIPEERALSYQQAWGSDQDDLYWTSLTSSGERVTVESAMRVAVGKCVRLLSDDISSLPLDVFAGQEPTALPQWMVTPTGRPTDLFMSYVSDWVTSQGMDGNTFTLALPNVFAPEYVEVLDPVATEILDDRPDHYRLPSGVEAKPNTILHVPWMRIPGTRRGVSPVKDSKESIGLELAAQQWVGAFFANGGALGGIVSVPGGPETVNAEKMREQFVSRHTGSDNWWKPAVLTGGATYDTNTISPKDAELGPLWTHVLEEAMAIFHIPPHLMSVIDTGAAARASVEERGIGYVRHAIRPFTTRFERAHSLMLQRNQYVRTSTA
jgi:HK97 family phage portal protein